MIKFNKHNVTQGNLKARVRYSIASRVDERAAVSIYAKDHLHDLAKIFGAAYENESDPMTDYFEKGQVTLFEDHPLYAAAKARAEQNAIEDAQRWADTQKRRQERYEARRA